MKTAAILLFGSIFSLQCPVWAEDDNTERLQEYAALVPINTIYDDAEVAVRTANFNNWLNENIDTISSDRLPKLREHLYYLIDSHIKNQYAGSAYPPTDEADVILAILFSWSERLGVYGGSLIHQSIKPASMPPAPRAMEIPNRFELAFHDNLLELESKTGNWQARVPYYFMIGRMQEFVANNGQLTQMVIISTGAAHHEGTNGHSQATLMILSTSDTNTDEFATFWKKRFSIDKHATSKKLNDLGLLSQHIFDETTALHTEFVNWPMKRGNIGVAYLGINGPFQHNRPHFLEFLKTLTTDLAKAGSND